MYRSTKQKTNKETQTLNDTIDKLDLIDIYRKDISPQNNEFHLFLKCTRNVLQDRSHPGHKSGLDKFKKIEIIPSIFSDHNALRLDVNYRRKTIKNSNIWRLNNTLLNNQQITEEIKKYIKMNENENTTTQKLWGHCKSSANEKVHSNTGIPQETRKKSNK